MSALYTSLLELAEQRKSCRHFTAEPVSDDAVEQILAVAARAPFASGRSNWKVASAQTWTPKPRRFSAATPKASPFSKRLRCC